jgi:hypothetical protein
VRKSLVVQLQAHLAEGKRSPMRAKTRLTKSAVGEIISSRTQGPILDLLASRTRNISMPWAVTARIGDDNPRIEDTRISKGRTTSIYNPPSVVT